MADQCIRRRLRRLTPNLAAILDKAIGELDKSHNLTAEKSHWSTRWGPFTDLPSMFETRFRKLPLTDRTEIQDYMPIDILTLAACYDRHDIVLTYFDQFGSFIEARQMTRLLACTASFFTRDKTGFYQTWNIASWEEVEILHRTIKLGADLGIGLRSLLWEMVLEFVYIEMLENVMPNLSFSLCDVFATFLQTGLAVEPVIRIYVPLPYGNPFFMDLDTALAPLIRPLFEEHGRSSELQRFDASQQYKAHTTALRIWFGRQSGRYELSDEHLVEAEESSLFLESLKKIISQSVRSNQRYRRRDFEELEAAVRGIRWTRFGSAKALGSKTHGLLQSARSSELEEELSDCSEWETESSTS